MTQEEVAKELRLSVGAIQRLEKEAHHKLKSHTSELNKIRGLLALRNDDLWPRPYWVLSFNGSSSGGR